MKQQFKIGMKVKVVRSGWGCSPNEIGRIVMITKIKKYRSGVGYKVSPAIGNTRTGDYGGFIGEPSFESAEEDIQRTLE